MRFFFWLVVIQVSTAESSGCSVRIGECPSHPEMSKRTMRDTDGERFMRTGEVEAACHLRAADYGNFCSSSDVTASFNPTGTSQRAPGRLACEKGWVFWAGNCYLYSGSDYRVTWAEADSICRSFGGALASVHSDAENGLISYLSNGVSCWIGYVDIRKSEKDVENFQWVDKTQNDFNNWAVDCSKGGEGCSEPERREQWFDWRGDDPGPFVCKKPARQEEPDLILGPVINPLSASQNSSIESLIVDDPLLKEDKISETEMFKKTNTLIFGLSSPMSY